jgi:hypothetical protein
MRAWGGGWGAAAKTKLKDMFRLGTVLEHEYFSIGCMSIF